MEPYDVALSFAGEDRSYVDQVAHFLLKEGISVFYDKFEEVDIWGRDLAEHLLDIYARKAKFCVMFISQYYVSKAWPTQERRGAISRALRSDSPYILPVRFDDSPVPGLSETMAYIDLRNITPQELAGKIITKIRKPDLNNNKNNSLTQINLDTSPIENLEAPFKMYIMAPMVPKRFYKIEDYQWIFDEFRFILDTRLNDNNELFKKLKEKPPYELTLPGMPFSDPFITIVDGLFAFMGNVRSIKTFGRNFLVLRVKQELPSLSKFDRLEEINPTDYARILLLNTYMEGEPLKNDSVTKVFQSYDEFYTISSTKRKKPEGLPPASPIPYYFANRKKNDKDFFFAARSHLVAALVTSGIFYEIKRLNLSFDRKEPGSLSVDFLGLTVPNDDFQFGEPIEINGFCNLEHNYIKEFYSKISRDFKKK